MTAMPRAHPHLPAIGAQSLGDGWQAARGAAAAEVEQRLRAFLMSDEFSCLMGKTASRKDTLRHRHYRELGAPDVTAALAAELADFAEHKDDVDPLVATFVATFDGPEIADEEHFERLLWQQLQDLHEIDVRDHPWSADIDPDPSSPRFGFSAGGHPFFVVGLHPQASRITRRFALPTLVFNSHVQFDRLKERGIYARVQRQIRAREVDLQGSLNPNLAEFGELSEARQYSGRAVPVDWECPFQPSQVVGQGVQR